MPASVLKDKSLCFVDVETTGTNAVSGRIIEIGILKVKNGELIERFTSLVNPELRIDPFIEQMTGINYQDLENAPLFSDIKERVFEILFDSIFVAHNVRFDYSFVRSEFRRHEINFVSKHFDTVKLARVLYPGHTHYNLDAIMKRHGIDNVGRHRAFGDAKVLWDFFKISSENIQPDVFESALKFVLKMPFLPAGLSTREIDKLPETPGVYIFYGEGGMPIYIGKSIDVKDRVLSHFANDLANNTDMKIAQSAKSVEAIETAGDLSALLLESKLIKEMKPIYNRMLRHSRKMSVLLKKITDDGYYAVEIKTMDQVATDQIQDIIGVFKSDKQIKDYLFELIKEFKLCSKLMGITKDKGYCFNYQLGICNGACRGEEHYLKYNLRFDEAFYKQKIKKWNFPGPILIKEIGEKVKVMHIIDKWCYLGSIENEIDSFEDLKKEYIFDYDTYKILKRYLSNPNNLKTIININSGFTKVL